MTAALRFMPFGLFEKGAPAFVMYLGRVLPYAMMGMPVVYCLRGTDFAAAPHGMPEAAGVACAVLLHKRKHNTLLSVIAATAVYMILIRDM